MTVRKQILLGALFIFAGVLFSLTMPSTLMAVVSTGLGICGGMIIHDGATRWDERDQR